MDRYEKQSVSAALQSQVFMSKGAAVFGLALTMVLADRFTEYREDQLHQARVARRGGRH